MVNFGDAAEMGKADAVARNVDQLECATIESGAMPIEEGIRDDLIADALDDFEVRDPGTDDPWVQRDGTVDSASSDERDEILRRQQLLGKYYPFKIAGNTIIYVGSASLIYELCLAISLAPNVVEKPYNALPPLFERITVKLLTAFLGEGAQGYRTGWPPLSDRPTRFKEVVEMLHKQTDEWVWNNQPDLEDDPGPKRVKDAGVDVVVWKRLPDGRIGSLFFLGQCACGTDWTGKYADLNPQLIRDKWLRDLSIAREIRVFSIPFHVPSRARWREAGLASGLVLDRVRLTILGEQYSKLTSDIRTEIHANAKLVMPLLQVV